MFFVGVEYGRGAKKTPIDYGCEKEPSEIKKIYPNENWTLLTPSWSFNREECERDRFSENLKIQEIIYNFFKDKDENFITNHLFFGGDHSLNFAHFKAIADHFENEDIALIYIDAHLDIHTPQSSQAEASGSPHGTNVRHLLGEGDNRFLNLGGKSRVALRPENLFYIGTRSYEPSEIDFVKHQNIFTTDENDVNNIKYIDDVITKIKSKIGNKKYVISIDFDGINPSEFDAVQVPELGGISLSTMEHILPLLRSTNLIATEFVEYAPSFDKIGTSQKVVKSIIDNFVK